jgi:type IV pilus assembly protein PilW
MDKHFMRRDAQYGFSMVELMIAMTIGLMIAAGLVTIFANTSNTQQELRRTSQQLENGRYAMDVISQDVQVTGYFGSYRKLTPPSTAPDPCSTTVGPATNPDSLAAAINLPIQAYNAATITVTAPLPATCNALLPAANLALGSDVIVVRRSDTQIVPIGTVTAAGQVYSQVNPSQPDIHLGTGVATTCTSRADGTTATVTRRVQYPAATDICPTTALPAGYIRKFHVHIYFVSPCNVPATGTTCGADADGGRPIPTLKRAELTTDGANPTFQIVSIAEGVEIMQLAYGIDDSPGTVNLDTGLIGDGSPDRYVNSPTLAELSNVVTARIDLLVRNPEPSASFTDTKTYALGIDPITPTNPGLTVTPGPGSLDPSYRRHVYNAEIRLVNMSSRKEIP